MYTKLILAVLMMFLMGCSSVKYVGYLCDVTFSPPEEKSIVMQDGY